MVDDLATRLIAHNSCGCGCSSDTRRLIGEAADEIERLREERDYLRHELNNETDRYMTMKETNSVHIAEIERLRTLITAWADADATYWTIPFTPENTNRMQEAMHALRKEAGR